MVDRIGGRGRQDWWSWLAGSVVGGDKIGSRGRQTLGQCVIIYCINSHVKIVIDILTLEVVKSKLRSTQLEAFWKSINAANVE